MHIFLELTLLQFCSDTGSVTEPLSSLCNNLISSLPPMRQCYIRLFAHTCYICPYSLFASALPGEPEFGTAGMQMYGVASRDFARLPPRA